MVVTLKRVSADCVLEESLDQRGSVHGETRPSGYIPYLPETGCLHMMHRLIRKAVRWLRLLLMMTLTTIVASRRLISKTNG